MKSTVCKQDKGERMDIDALRQAHEKLKRKSLKQRDRLRELEEGIRDYGIEVSGRKILLASNVFKRLCKLLTPTKDR